MRQVKLATFETRLKFTKQDIIDAARSDGFEDGQEVGRKERSNISSELTALDMLRDHKPMEEILKYSRLTRAHVNRLAKKHGLA